MPIKIDVVERDASAPFAFLDLISSRRRPLFDFRAWPLESKGVALMRPLCRK
jgi:hypothetical protein